MILTRFVPILTNKPIWFYATGAASMLIIAIAMLLLVIYLIIKE